MRVTRLHQIVVQKPNGRQIVVLQPGDRDEEQAATLRRLLGQEYAALVETGVIAE